MVRNIMSKLLLAAGVLSSANAYFLFAMNDVIATERLDPIVNPGGVSGHTHTIFGGSNFRATTNTSFLRQSECTSSPINEDKSAYWAPTLYFQWKNGSFTSVSGNPVMYYLFSDTPGTTTPFPDDFRMISGTPTLRSYNASSYAQQAVTFLCLDFNGVTTKSNELPSTNCPSGIRAQINFPSCWDGKNTDSSDHKSHVAYLSGGPDSGTCSDPKYPVTLPRVFMEMYLDTATLYGQRDQAMNPDQPFVYAMGDPTGYGYHADFLMGWESGVLQKVVDGCNCNPYGDPTCCSDAGIFTFTHGGQCRITQGVDEIVTGTLDKLPGNNPVVPLNGVAQNLAASVTPAFIQPVYAYTGSSPTQTGSPVGAPVTATGAAPTSSTAAPPAKSSAVASSSSQAAAAGSSSKAAVASASSQQAAASSSSQPAAASPSSKAADASSSPATAKTSSTAAPAQATQPAAPGNNPAAPSSKATASSTKSASTSSSTHGSSPNPGSGSNKSGHCKHNNAGHKRNQFGRSRLTFDEPAAPRYESPFRRYPSGADDAL
ncbi:WSC domain-containing protein [Roridomyces roridus]|uniref:WSC domain-containing protein n=1 Tax=Roridomyces roridus TaxID=1738132 RepID=A0AAD7CK03_9AGAR|nr:WSC domain-containing protein [Roridomyces roridus]